MRLRRSNLGEQRGMQSAKIGYVRRCWNRATQQSRTTNVRRFSPTRRRRRPNRRGSILILTAVLLVIVLACVAFAIDSGYMFLVRSQSQNAADAAAMAAAWHLLDERMHADYQRQQELFNEAREVGFDYATRNRVCGGGRALDRNTSNHPKGDLVFGRYQSGGQMSTFGNTREYNAVFARVGRTSANDASLSLFFARCLGFESADISAEAIALFRDGISGFRPNPDTGNTSLIPFAVHVDIWEDLMDGRVGSDNWTVDPDANFVAGGSDGILELNIYPTNTGASGNFGTLQIGNPNNGTPELNGRIADGISEGDLAFQGGEMGLGPCPGDPGISSGIKQGLAQTLGQPRSIALYDSVSRQGGNTSYNIVGFAGVRVVDFWLGGGETEESTDAGKRVVLQPSVVVDDSAIAGGGSSYTVYQPVVLAR